MPQPGNLKWIHCVTPTVKGNITIDFKREDNKKLSLIVDIPHNTQATVGIPKMKSGLSNISVNGKFVLQNKKRVGINLAAKFVGENRNYFLFDVKPGKWSFELF